MDGISDATVSAISLSRSMTLQVGSFANAPGAHEIVPSLLTDISGLWWLMEIVYFSSESEFFEIVRSSDNAPRTAWKISRNCRDHTIHIERPDRTTLILKLARR
jgi:hypothetical protein